MPTLTLTCYVSQKQKCHAAFFPEPKPIVISSLQFSRPGAKCKVYKGDLANSCPEQQTNLKLLYYSKTLKMLTKCSPRFGEFSYVVWYFHLLTLQIIDASKAWRDSWRDILGTQQRLVHGFHTIYSPILGADDSYSGRESASTPKRTMERTAKLQGLYDELRNDLLEEVDMAETRIIKPAMQAKDGIQPLKKVIKKRGDRKVCDIENEPLD
jgi:hypothetical protein